ncbi:MAG: hypothetical protein K8S87_11335, partial [Planctomycetes bacterium]|nr:hypothetical protein [Planctomycetota bacterium]
SREGFTFRIISIASLRKTFEMLRTGTFKREYLWNLIHTLAKKPEWTPEKILDRNKILPTLTESEVISIIDGELLKPANEHNLNKIDAKKYVEMLINHYMGKVMHKCNVKGRFSGNKVSKLIRVQIHQLIEQNY